MKSFTDLFIKRPVLAMVVSFVILIAGLQAMKTINVRQYPRSDIAAITVTTIYVGADAELVRGFITTPLERAIAAGAKAMEPMTDKDWGDRIGALTDPFGHIWMIATHKKDVPVEKVAKDRAGVTRAN